MHNKPHSEETKAKMRMSHVGKPATHNRRPHIVIDGETRWRCGRCKEFFHRDGFHKDKRTIFGLKSTCKKCHTQVSILSRDKDNKRIKSVIYESTRRARIANCDGNLTLKCWKRLLEVFGDTCACCKQLGGMTIDHVIPLSKGGIHHASNIQPLCRKCNEIKQARSHDYRTQAQKDEINKIWVYEFRRVKP